MLKVRAPTQPILPTSIELLTYYTRGWAMYVTGSGVFFPFLPCYVFHNLSSPPSPPSSLNMYISTP